MLFKFIDKINISDSLKERVIKLSAAEESTILKLTGQFLNRKPDCLKKYDDIMRLAVVLKAMEATYEKYREAGIDDEIFFDTFDDIRIWCEENGNKGLKNYGWLKNHIYFELFKLGRLQFQLYKCKNPILLLKRLPVHYNDRVLNIHIPRNGKLDREECIKSIKQAAAFFEKYFPEFHYKHMYCESWLLYGGNKAFMKPESNIMKFQSLFHLPYSFHYEIQTYDRLFGVDINSFGKKNLDLLPENTSLQKAAKAYKLSGGKFGAGIGTVKDEFIKR